MRHRKGLRVVREGDPPRRSYCVTACLTAEEAANFAALCDSLDRQASWVLRKLIEAELKQRRPKLDPKGVA